MSEVQANRTLVKSPPELWAELSDAETLARHLGDLGEIRITRTEPETAVAWEGEQISGTVDIAPSGWGTQVSLSAHIVVPEPEPPPPPAPPERVEYLIRVVDHVVVRIEPPPPPEPEEPPRRGFFSRLFTRPPDPSPPPEPPAPYELRVVHAVAACRVPERPAPPPPPTPEPAVDPGRVAGVLAELLDRLGSAHHRPFSRS